MVPFYQEVSLADQTHGGCLDSANRQERRCVQDGEVSGQVVPDHGICHASGIGGPACGLIALIVMQVSHSIPHGIRRRVESIQPVGLPCVVEPSQDLINEELAFFVRVSGMDDIFALFQKPSNLIEPLLGWRILMLLFICQSSK